MVRSEFFRSEQVLSWLGQFDLTDQDNVVALLRAMRLVSADEFSAGLRSRLIQSAAETEGAVALYTERELPKDATGVLPLFDQPYNRPRRAKAGRALAIDGTVEVGSEGLVAQLITELSRENADKFLNHPGPSELRFNSKKTRPPIRKFILVTDVIGSGNRAWQYLEAAWRVWTIKSLCSMGPHHGISFEVVTYASTTEGQKLVESHPVRPVIRKIVFCPTIDGAFNKNRATEIKRLCIQYDPYKRATGALGFRDTCALIAFAHGVPNNCPRIFWAEAKTWHALFPQRVSAATRSTFGSTMNADVVNDRLLAMRQRRLNEGYDWSKAPHGALERYLLLAALAHPPRRPAIIARKTMLTLLEVELLLEEAIEHKWVDSDYRVTDAGRAQLSIAKASSAKLPIPKRENLYYPTSLRAPSNLSS